MTTAEIPDGFEEWLHTGIEAGYCSEVVCNTHDGLPSSAAEDAEWEAGGDPCVPAVRLFWSMETGQRTDG
jgi:hypothetical protein